MKITQQLINKIAQQAQSNKNAYKDFFLKLKRVETKNLDKVVQSLHYQIFSGIDCLECANCCKTISPVLYEADIARLAKSLKIKTGDFKDTYTNVDEDGDFVFKNTPCPFLMADNFCMVYEGRPKACREYPHTNRKRFYQILSITEKNRAICPAVFEITERLKNEFDK